VGLLQSACLFLPAVLRLVPTMWNRNWPFRMPGICDRARSGNLDLQTAAARVRAARSSLAITSGERLPEMDGVGQASRNRQSALVAYNNEHQRLAALRRATEATREGVRLALVQYDTGLTDYNNVMTMQRDLFQLEEELATSEAQLDFELIALYKAVGGGW